MTDEWILSSDEINKLYKKLKQEAEYSGYFLNPDEEFAKELIKGLLINEKRYGYWSCPCRLACGDRSGDMDIICPCDYRDPDVGAFGACYCALYVSRSVFRKEKSPVPVPERRPPPDERVFAAENAMPEQERSMARQAGKNKAPYPVWRCKVCGYLCARDAPPELCPICKAKKDRFEIFM